MHIHIYIHTYILSARNLRQGIYTYTNAYVYTYMLMRTGSMPDDWTEVYKEHLHTHTHTHIHTYIHTYIHTHTHIHV